MFREFIDKQQQNLIIKITCFFWIFTKLFSYNLWHTDRLFPLLPPFDFLENIPNSIHLCLFALAILGIFFIAFFPKNKYLLIATIAVEFFSCILDQNRWQPWEYQYFLTIVFLFLYRNNNKQFANYFSFLIIVIYINSGLHKLNGSFLFHVWEDMILHRFFGFEHYQIQNTLLHYAGLSLGLIEVISGFGLLFLKRKKIFAWLIIGMHIFILLLISPTGVNYNPIVWPWNIAMILFLYILFINGKSAEISFKNLINGYNKIPFVIIGILPFFCLLGYYDNFLSFNLYSGGLKQLDICIGNEDSAKKYQPYFSKKMTFCTTGKVINVNGWGLKEMNIIVYPEERVFLDIIKKWKKANPYANATFYIYEYPYRPQYVREYN